MIAQRPSNVTEWKFASSIVVAVTSLTCTVGASNDDIACEGIAGAVIAVGISGAGDSISGRVAAMRQKTSN